MLEENYQGHGGAVRYFDVKKALRYPIMIRVSNNRRGKNQIADKI